MLTNRIFLNQQQTHSTKKGSTKPEYVGPLASGLNRRAFLKTSGAISLLAGLTACKPSVSDFTDTPPEIAPSTTQSTSTTQQLPASKHYFSESQQKTLDIVQMHLFPDDGNGPSARDLNAIEYLEWAMSDQQNIDDGDPEFIAKGVGWLNDLSEQTQGDQFTQLPLAKQDKVLKQIANSKAGENWLSILIYYLTEALTLDPVYGGNPNQIGWRWLEHQAGFPAPVAGKTYRDFTE